VRPRDSEEHDRNPTETVTKNHDLLILEQDVGRGAASDYLAENTE
jgi:hypothetical protein